ncbi:putative rhamnogalacturonan II specific xylosyltransferase [Paratrimastix pyriformis]|uniref:Rhamnogalacturonan II specific xylosyltransferase n=1 Tax=Paratrimastix pyriformis TaxID=342808 RepID=A0ABQ8UCM2_9EUKA|nr:putative rhamnogalacturonan II specific xylosyltransferase [Paratrimastix pyriformis]
MLAARSLRKACVLLTPHRRVAPLLLVLIMVMVTCINIYLSPAYSQALMRSLATSPQGAADFCPKIHFLMPTVPRPVHGSTPHPLLRTVESFLHEFRDHPALFPFDLWIYNMRPKAHPTFALTKIKYQAEIDSGLLHFIEIDASAGDPKHYAALTQYITGEKPASVSKPKLAQTRDFFGMLVHFYRETANSTLPHIYKWSPETDAELYFLMEDDFIFCPNARIHIARFLQPLAPNMPLAPTGIAAVPLVTNLESLPDPVVGSTPDELLHNYLNRWAGFRFAAGLNGLLLQHRDIPALAALSVEGAPTLPVDYLCANLWLGIDPRGAEHFGANRPFYVYRYLQMLHIGAISTISNTYPVGFQCNDPILGMWTWESYLPECAPLSDTAPCDPPTRRTAQLYAGPRNDQLDRHETAPLSLALSKNKSTVALPVGEGGGTIPKYHVGAGLMGETCTQFCKRVHHPRSECQPRLLAQVNSCEDMQMLLGCTWCYPESLPTPYLPARLFGKKCMFSWVPRHATCEASKEDAERISEIGAGRWGWMGSPKQMRGAAWASKEIDLAMCSGSWCRQHAWDESMKRCRSEFGDSHISPRMARLFACLGIPVVAVGTFLLMLNIMSWTASINQPKDAVILKAPHYIPQPTWIRRHGAPKVPTEEEGKRELKELLAATEDDPDHTIIMATVSDGFYDFTVNWLCWMAKLPKIHPYLFLATDEAVYLKLKAVGQPVHLLKAPGQTGTTFTYSTIAYQELMHTRTLFVKDLLDQGYSVLIADTDALLLQDPFPIMEPLMATNDVLYSNDDSRQGHSIACGGFFWLRSCEAARTFWAEVARQHGEMVEDFKRRGVSSVGDASEQSIINQIFAKKTFPELRHQPLDHMQFRNGYFYWQLNLRTPTPVLVHNNWIIGRDKKVARFQEAGLWLVNQNNYCPTPAPKSA